MTLAPTLLLAVLSAAYFDQVVLSFLPLYALYFGLSKATASFALGVLSEIDGEIRGYLRSMLYTFAI